MGHLPHPYAILLEEGMWGFTDECPFFTHIRLQKTRRACKDHDRIDGSEASAAAPRDGNYSLVSSRHYFVCSSPERSRLCPEGQGVQHPLEGGSAKL
jgi:hypothetical protein